MASALECVSVTAAIGSGVFNGQIVWCDVLQIWRQLNVVSMPFDEQEVCSFFD